jgi:hypothetical protein
VDSAPSQPTTITFRRRGIRIREVYFDDDAAIAQRGTDLVRVLAMPESRDGAGARLSHTAVVDLTLTDEELLAAMAKGTRYEIRRARDKEGLDAAALDRPDAAIVRQFADYYDEFASTKGLAAVFRPRLEAMAEAGILTLTRTPATGPDVAVWHAYARSPRHALLLYSASLFRTSDDTTDRAAAGRANRFLHWHDMLHFKMSGCVSYDLGGIDVEGRGEETARIASFKRGFGGLVRPTYAWSSPTSVRGRAAYAALSAMGVDF